MPMTNTQIPRAITSFSALLPVLLLVLVGAMIALSVNLSKLVADAGAPILWLVSLAIGGAGVVIFALAASLGQVQGHAPRLLAYAVGAGAFLAVPTGLSFLSVAHVGAGFLSLSYAFPVLATYLLAMALGMERLHTSRVLAVGCGFSGGVLLAWSKFQTVQSGSWLAAVALIPLIIAVGNIYRTRYWPAGAGAIFLAALTLMIAGLFLGLLASITEGALVQRLWQQEGLIILLLANLAVFTVQFVFYFMLQRIAGPTYLSQIGAVGAIIGVAIAFFLFKEIPPANFPLAIGLVATGLVLFQRTTKKPPATHSPR